MCTYLRFLLENSAPLTYLVAASQRKFKSVKARVSLVHTKKCPDCHGVGKAADGRPCPTCDGTGEVVIKRQPSSDSGGAPSSDERAS
jgi:RecJ-like exonuclease